MISASRDSQELLHLIAYFGEMPERRQKAIASLYEVPASFGEPGTLAERLALFFVQCPEIILEVTRRELKSAAAWRTLSEVVIEHDDGTVLDWAPARHRQILQRLGLIRVEVDEQGHEWSSMPGLVASIFASHVEGERGSLPILLGRAEEAEVRALCEIWGLPSEGTKQELIGVLVDFYSREEMMEEMLQAIPNPDWIGDALMILELGGLCHWQQIYGYDLETTLGQGTNVVPLMRRADRQQQQEIAETLMARGMIFRIESPGEEYTMVAVPEELWRSLWELGRVWLLEWVLQAVSEMGDEGLGQSWQEHSAGLQEVLKWLLIEAEAGRLRAEDGGITEESRRILAPVYSAGEEPRWQDWWALGIELGVLARGEGDEVKQGSEALALLNRRPVDFRREVLLEWCVNYSGASADRRLSQAIGLDDEWRQRALQLLRAEGEMAPIWMHTPGVDPAETGGGWLRDPESGTDDIMHIEISLTIAFVVLLKLTWLDLLSLLPGDRSYSIEGLVELLQCVAAFSMFSHLGLVLRNHPIAVYLPFQRASFLMDQYHESLFREWVEDIVDSIFVPLGIAERSEGGARVMLDTEPLRIESPPGWPEEDRFEIIRELFGPEMEFEIPRRRETELRAVAPSSNGEDGYLSVDEPIEELMAAVGKNRVLSFDGRRLKIGKRNSRHGG